MARSDATVSRTDGITSPTPFDRLVRQMSLEADIAQNENGNSTAVHMVEAILSTDSEAEMWDSDDLLQINGKALADVEQTITDFDVRFSSRDDIETAFIDETGRKMYLLVKATKLENGEEIVWNTGAPVLVSKLMWLREHGKFPAEVVIRGVDLGGGKTFLKLKPVPKRAVQR